MADPGMPQVRAQETHSGVVISIGERTYKLKKPVDLGFLDFRSREQRQAVCRREVELNRRLAPDVYLGVADVHGPEGELCEHLVVMRRLPGERSLAALVEAGEAVEDCLDGVAARLAAFHAAAYCVEFDDRLRYVDGADDAATLAMDLQARGREPRRAVPAPLRRPRRRSPSAATDRALRGLPRADPNQGSLLALVPEQPRAERSPAGPPAARPRPPPAPRSGGAAGPGGRATRHRQVH